MSVAHLYYSHHTVESSFHTIITLSNNIYCPKLILFILRVPNNNALYILTYENLYEGLNVVALQTLTRQGFKKYQTLSNN